MTIFIRSKLLILLVWSIVFVGIAESAQAESSLGPRSPEQDKSTSLSELPCFSPSGTPVTFRDLKEEIVSRKINSTADLLKFFSTHGRYISFLRAPVLEEISDAIHGDEASSAFPRIVLHAGNMVIHFVGDPKFRGHELVEVSEFDPLSAAFKFKAIDFAIKDPSQKFIENDGEALDIPEIAKAHEEAVGKSVFSCNTCHGKTPNGLAPIWSLPRSLFRPFGNNLDVITAGSEQRKRYLEFQKTYSDPSEANLYKYLKISVMTSQDGQVIFSENPNQVLTNDIYSKAIYSLARQTSAFPDYPLIRYATLAAYIGCDDDITEFLSPEYRAKREAEIKYDFEMRERFHGGRLPVRILDSVNLLSPENRAALKAASVSDENGNPYVTYGQLRSIGNLSVLKALYHFKYWALENYIERGKVRIPPPNHGGL